jgi:hypothetical protein
MRTSFEPARSFANPLDFQDQLDRWFTGRANPRFHRGIRAVPAERLIEERKRMRSLPSPMPATALRSVLRVPQQPYFRFDTNDYSLDPGSPAAASSSRSDSRRSRLRRSTPASSAPGTPAPSHAI